MAETLVLTWAWRYHSLYCDDCAETLNEAVRMARAASDDGQQALDCIEVWDESGYRKYSDDEIWEMADKLEEAEPKPVYTPSVAEVQIIAPGRHETSREWYSTVDAAETRAATLRPFLGDRVSVKLLETARVS